MSRLKKMTAKAESERFQSGAEKYAAYVATPEGRLRLDIAFANLLEFLPRVKGSLRALDLGCGTGATAVRLAQLGLHVTLLDSSPAMLDIATRAARQAGVTDKLAVTHGDVAQVADLFHTKLFDVILCHNILEYVDDPKAVLRSVVRVLRNPPAILSVLVRNQAGEVLKAAIQAGDLAAAERNLNAEWGHESLYGGRVRLFKSDGVRTMLKAASLTVFAERGVRVISDYLPPSVSRTSEYERMFKLERQLSSQPEFTAIARYTQFLAHRGGAAKENGA